MAKKISHSHYTLIMAAVILTGLGFIFPLFWIAAAFCAYAAFFRSDDEKTAKSAPPKANIGRDDGQEDKNNEDGEDKTFFQHLKTSVNDASKGMETIAKNIDAVNRDITIFTQSQQLLRDFSSAISKQHHQLSTLVELAQSLAEFNKKMKKLPPDEREERKKRLNEARQKLRELQNKQNSKPKNEEAHFVWQALPSQPISGDSEVQQRIDEKVKILLSKRQKQLDDISQQCASDKDFEQAFIEYLVKFNCPDDLAEQMVNRTRYALYKAFLQNDKVN